MDSNIRSELEFFFQSDEKSQYLSKNTNNSWATLLRKMKRKYKYNIQDILFAFILSVFSNRCSLLMCSLGPHTSNDGSLLINHFDIVILLYQVKESLCTTASSNNLHLLHHRFLYILSVKTILAAQAVLVQHIWDPQYTLSTTMQKYIHLNLLTYKTDHGIYNFINVL